MKIKIFSLFLLSHNPCQAKSQLSSQLSLKAIPIAEALTHVREFMLLWLRFFRLLHLKFCRTYTRTFPMTANIQQNSLDGAKSMQRLHENGEREIQSVGGELENISYTHANLKSNLLPVFSTLKLSNSGFGKIGVGWIFN